MTEPQPQPQPYGPPPQAGQPVPPKKKSKLPWILGGVVLVLLLCCGGGVLISANSDTPASKGKQVDRTADPVAQPATTSAAPAQTTAAAPKYGTPKPGDLKLTVKELDKQCFGSAGCNLQFRISKVTYTGPDLDPSATYEISYSYKGLSDPMTGTFELAGDGSYSVDETEYGQTSSSAKKVTAVVTAIEKM